MSALLSGSNRALSQVSECIRYGHDYLEVLTLGDSPGLEAKQAGDWKQERHGALR